mmetsp:Transcript_54836/g.61295  ORF Transcript_54836/g.61295 Transcript_54836/m.61295 type:complete len:84 (-) Transcript_54836:22-273(-)
MRVVVAEKILTCLCRCVVCFMTNDELCLDNKPTIMVNNINDKYTNDNNNIGDIRNSGSGMKGSVFSPLSISYISLCIANHYYP